jgi:hypothetical protein
MCFHAVSWTSHRKLVRTRATVGLGEGGWEEKTSHMYYRHLQSEFGLEARVELRDSGEAESLLLALFRGMGDIDIKQRPHDSVSSRDGLAWWSRTPVGD